MSAAQSAALLLSAPSSLVHATLLDPGAFPAWNPAFRTLAGNGPGTLDERYTLTVRPGLTGHFWYETIEADHVVMRWEVPGFAELGTWDLTMDPGGTRVVHRFEHTGLLAAALTPAFKGVAQLRLDRLAEHLRS